MVFFMRTSVLSCALLASALTASGYQKPTPHHAVSEELNEAPKGYRFAFSSDDVESNQRREETVDDDGNVKGSYSFALPDGTKRHVKYIADDGGFRVKIDSNEHGVEAKSPADAKFTKAAKPEAAQGWNTEQFGSLKAEQTWQQANTESHDSSKFAQLKEEGWTQNAAQRQGWSDAAPQRGWASQSATNAGWSDETAALKQKSRFHSAPIKKQSWSDAQVGNIKQQWSSNGDSNVSEWSPKRSALKASWEDKSASVKARSSYDIPSPNKYWAEQVSAPQKSWAPSASSSQGGWEDSSSQKSKGWSDERLARQRSADTQRGWDDSSSAKVKGWTDERFARQQSVAQNPHHAAQKSWTPAAAVQRGWDASASLKSRGWSNEPLARQRSVEASKGHTKAGWESKTAALKSKGWTDAVSARQQESWSAKSAKQGWDNKPAAVKADLSASQKKSWDVSSAQQGWEPNFKSAKQGWEQNTAALKQAWQPSSASVQQGWKASSQTEPCPDNAPTSQNQGWDSVQQGWKDDDIKHPDSKYEKFTLDDNQSPNVHLELPHADKVEWFAPPADRSAALKQKW